MGGFKFRHHTEHHHVRLTATVCFASTKLPEYRRGRVDWGYDLDLHTFQWQKSLIIQNFISYMLAIFLAVFLYQNHSILSYGHFEFQVAVTALVIFLPIAF